MQEKQTIVIVKDSCNPSYSTVFENGIKVQYLREKEELDRYLSEIKELGVKFRETRTGFAASF
jgi:phosphosulfolactate synthase (CoM biosynthesis protein A)